MIGGRTPGFTWDIPSASVGGHRVLRMPTTVDHDYRMYINDFVMATTESDLPVYGTSGTNPIPAPQAPTSVRVIRMAAAFFDRALAFLSDPS